ncbi:MAG: hypothetical protein ACLSA6_18505 [Holdemania massiliensis]
MYEGQEYPVQTNLVAMFNLYNLLAVIAALHEGGLPLEQILDQLNTIPQIEGRMERIEEGQPFNIIVDFAHTRMDWNKSSFASAITPKEKRIISVFGSTASGIRRNVRCLASWRINTVI